MPAGSGHDDLLISAALTARLERVDCRERVAQGKLSIRRKNGRAYGRSLLSARFLMRTIGPLCRRVQTAVRQRTIAMLPNRLHGTEDVCHWRIVAAPHHVSRLNRLAYAQR